MTTKAREHLNEHFARVCEQAALRFATQVVAHWILLGRSDRGPLGEEKIRARLADITRESTEQLAPIVLFTKATLDQNDELNKRPAIPAGATILYHETGSQEVKVLLDHDKDVCCIYDAALRGVGLKLHDPTFLHELAHYYQQQMEELQRDARTRHH